MTPITNRNEMLKKLQDFGEKNRQVFEWIFSIAYAFAGVMGIHYLATICSNDLFGNGFLAVLLLGGIAVLIKKSIANIGLLNPKAKRRRVLYVFFLSLFIGLTLVFGYQLRFQLMTECGFRGKGKILFYAFLLTGAIFPFMNGLFYLFEKAANRADRVCKLYKRRNVFFISWAVIFVSWIPAFLAYYPTIMSYDFHGQAQMAMKGFIYFSAHHPLVHTWLIWLFLKIGEAMGSYATGLACLSIFHILLVSVAMAYSITVIYKMIKNRVFLFILVAFLALFPYNPVMVLCTTKDVIFSALFLVFVTLIMERHFFCEGRNQLVFDILIVTEGILMILFRNNAIYAVGAAGVICLIVLPMKQKLRVLILVILLCGGGKLALMGVKGALGTQIEGNGLEKYSVILQQFARVGYYHEEDMEDYMHEVINRYVSDEHWFRYNPPISDSVKIWVASQYDSEWKGNMVNVLKDWMYVGMRYPNEYLDAFLSLTSGYWFIDDRTYAEVLGSGLEDRMGTIFTYNSSQSDAFEGVEHVSKWPAVEQFYENIVSANQYFDWPGVSILFKAPFYSLSFFFLLVAFIYTKQKKKVLLCIFPLMYLGTLFLGPVVWVRYLFPIMLCLPLLLALLIYNPRRENPKYMAGIIAND